RRGRHDLRQGGEGRPARDRFGRRRSGRDHRKAWVAPDLGRGRHRGRRRRGPRGEPETGGGLSRGEGKGLQRPRGAGDASHAGQGEPRAGERRPPAKARRLTGYLPGGFASSAPLGSFFSSTQRFLSTSNFASTSLISFS